MKKSELVNQLLVSIKQHGDGEVSGELRVVDVKGEPIMGKRCPVSIESGPEITKVVLEIPGNMVPVPKKVDNPIETSAPVN